MNNKILFLTLCILNTALFAKPVIKPLELQPLLKDRFEKSCAIRQQYDFHDENTELNDSFLRYASQPKYIEKQAYEATIYQLENVTYHGIPIRKIEFSFGRPAQQYNEFLYFDLKTKQAKTAFKTLKFKQNHEDANVSVEYKPDLAIVQCYWLQAY